MSDESETIEHKLSLAERKEIVESVASFATAHGGVIQIGVNNDGAKVGVRIGNRTLEDLANLIKDNTNPSQFPSISHEGTDDAVVVTVTVDECPIKPVWAFGRPLKRVGRTNQRLSPEETKRLMDNTSGRTWDALPCPDLLIADIDRPLVESFLRRAELDTTASTETALRNMNLLIGSEICNAAALLFTNNPGRYVIEAQVMCARFDGITSVRFLDERSIFSNVFTQLDEALAFVTRNTRQQPVITGRPERDVVPEYPADAIREAITNAICHRDYAMTGTVQIRIYDDRLEVWNPGMLPTGMSVEELYHEHPSRPRNPRLASAMHRARLIEHWGTGTLRIINACESRGMPKPEFVSFMGSFIVRFNRALNEPTPETNNEPSGWQQIALNYIRENGSITTSVFQKLLGVSNRQAYRYLMHMVDEGIIIRQGSGRAIQYLHVNLDME
ncbi:MAG: ATP-binding protein [Armatimonadota bacterium]